MVASKRRKCRCLGENLISEKMPQALASGLLGLHNDPGNDPCLVRRLVGLGYSLESFLTFFGTKEKFHGFVNNENCPE